MPPAIAAVTGAITAINRAAFYIAISLVYLIVPVMLIDVVARYAFNAPTVWGMELATLLFGPYFLLAGPYVLHLKGHVAMDILRQRLKLQADRMVELVNLPIIIAFCAILLWFSVPAAVDSFNYGETSFSAQPADLVDQGCRTDCPAADAAAGAGRIPACAVPRPGRCT